MKNTSVQIKRIQLEEIDLIVDYFNEYRIFYKQPSDLSLARSFLTERLKNNESVIFMAYDVDDNNIIPLGFTQLYPRISSVSAKKNWHIGDLYTNPLFRKNGVGSALLKQACDFASAEGGLLLSLYTAKDNLTAQSVYERFGFKQIELLPDYFYYQFDIQS